MNRTGDIIGNALSWGTAILATMTAESALVVLSVVVSSLTIIKLALDIMAGIERRRRNHLNGGYSTEDEDGREDNDE
jgi:hypothetical protein